MTHNKSYRKEYRCLKNNVTGGGMTQGSVKEYVEAVRERYRMASRREKGEILDEFSRVTRYHRKAAIRLLRTSSPGAPGRRRGRPRQYSQEVTGALKVVWEASDRLCSKRLKPFLPELIRVLHQYGELQVTPKATDQLCQLSASTIGRLLRPYRAQGGRHSLSTTKPGSLLKASIPIRTFADWNDKRPGFLEVDLVAHCGESTEGFYLNTLSAVDVATGWVECRGVWGKGQDRVGSAIHHVSQQLPFPLRAWTRTTAVSSSTIVYTATARRRLSPSPALAPTRRTTVPTWSRRTGRWCADW